MGRTGEKENKTALDFRNQLLVFQSFKKKEPSLYQACFIAAWSIAAVCPIGEGALLAAFLLAVLKTKGNELQASEQREDGKWACVTW